MAITDVQFQTRGTPWTVTADGYILSHMSLTFYTTHKTGAPTQDVGIAITVTDAKDDTGGNGTPIKSTTIQLSGTANVVGLDNPLQETTYNQIITDLLAYLGAQL